VLPNVIIAGAPKCGTSSLYRYLSVHPDVCMSNLSETRYLIDKGRPFYNAACNFHNQGMAGYERLFSHCHDSRKNAVVDVTPDYLYQATPLAVLPQISPLPRIIFILRNPQLRTYSFFQFARNNVGIIAKGMSFKKFIEMNKASAKKQAFDPFHPYNAHEHSKYIKYLNAYVEAFGLDNIHIFLFEALKRSPENFMRRMCQVLDIDPAMYKTYPFAVHNKTHHVKNQKFHQVRRKMRGKIPSQRISHMLSRVYNCLNIKPAVKKFTREEFSVLEQLRDEYSPYNLQLANVFGIDLSVWGNVPDS